MELPLVYNPPSLEATYSDFAAVFSMIQRHIKYNSYALFKRDVSPSQVICVYNRYNRPQTKGKDPRIHESRKR
jgi:hypothetical protein